MKKDILTLNASMSIVQVAVTSCVLFILYWFLIYTIGVTSFGVWSLVLAATSVSGMARFGFDASTVKFVSMHLARENETRVVQVIQTSLITVGTFLGLLLFLIYPFLLKLLEVVVPIENHHDAFSILPYAFASFWLSSLAGITYSCIDGYQRIYLRCLVIIASSILYLILAFILTPLNGLVGIAQAQVLQAAFLLCVAWTCLKILSPRLPLIPYRWNRGVFKEMFSYSVNFQLISISQILFEPVTKALLSLFGGVGMVGYFEMANRMVVQVRLFIVTAYQSIVPAIADMQESNPSLIQELYVKLFQLVLYITLPSLPFFITLTPVISRIWFGSYLGTFIFCAIILFVGWFVNITAAPSYFANMGIGTLRWNVISHYVIGVLNVPLGYVLGSYFGGYGVVSAFVLSLVTGSLLITVTYHRRHKIRFFNILQGESVLLGAAGVLSMLFMLLIFYALKNSLGAISLGILMTGGYTLLVIVPLWRHPLRSSLIRSLSSSLFRKSSYSEIT